MDSEPAPLQWVKLQEHPLPKSANYVALVADDNIGHQAALTAILGALGLGVEVAGDGLAALEACASRQFDLVLMDVSMPRMDGLTATRELRAFESAHQVPRTPIIMVTSHDEPEDRDMSAAAGADAHVGKPVLLRSLVAAVHQVFPAAA